MAKRDETHGAAVTPGADLAEAILALAPRDLMFVMQFVGETQYKVLQYFQKLVIRELEAHDIRREDHALLQIFIDKHATEMRDFVFSGVALSRPFQIEEIERLLGDTTNVLRLDIWDALRSHIEMVETQFVAQAESLPEQLAAIQAEADGYAKR